ncbi:MAG: single-stranded DNA-binding protein [Rhodopirellula sp.]|nr:single-stranded DNA-binding protein [Rhodopirellula sp.]
MPNFNKVILVGHLTRDPELTYTKNQTAICKFGLAVNHKHGEREEVCFVDVTAWGKQGEAVQKYLHKGDCLLVEGRLTFERWTDKEGGNRSKHSVTMTAMSFMGKAGEQKQEKQQTHEPEPQAECPPYDPEQPDDIPF